jgi:hypothetical protein
LISYPALTILKKKDPIVKGGGTPNQFTVSLMPFFRGFISKVCRKNKVSEGINKKGKPQITQITQIFLFFLRVPSCFTVTSWLIF